MYTNSSKKKKQYNIQWSTTEQDKWVHEDLWAQILGLVNKQLNLLSTI
jgi:hypothetical protein